MESENLVHDSHWFSDVYADVKPTYYNGDYTLVRMNIVRGCVMKGRNTFNFVRAVIAGGRAVL